jgi:hypothetical protein
LPFAELRLAVSRSVREAARASERFFFNGSGFLLSCASSSRPRFVLLLFCSLPFVAVEAARDNSKKVHYWECTPLHGPALLMLSHCATVKL